ncbi:HID1 domain containing [Phyllostomus discolor]|uniref:HID1 domain containing n=1 Tax=Phyllostomus discolor TaxID=89673 RepID=A0A834DVD6_9CHIR|nr:HID1 domain containing [Phyllostomus discolor]
MPTCSLWYSTRSSPAGTSGCSPSSIACSPSSSTCPPTSRACPWWPPISCCTCWRPSPPPGFFLRPVTGTRGTRREGQLSSPPHPLPGGLVGGRLPPLCPPGPGLWPPLTHPSVRSLLCTIGPFTQ